MLLTIGCNVNQTLRQIAYDEKKNRWMTSPRHGLARFLHSHSLGQCQNGPVSERLSRFSL